MSPPAATAPTASIWGPLRQPLYRALWLAYLASNVGTWLQSVGAAWLMATLTSSPTMIALVQAAASLPMFLLSLPAGALADVVDRRRLLIFTQSWMLFAAAGLGLLTLADLVTPTWLLLGIVFLGLGAALNAPAWQAITPELVPSSDVPAAVVLGSINFNIARSVGPALGGLLVAAVGPAAAFLLNGASFFGVVVVLQRWRRPPQESAMPAENLFGAMQAGLRYVRHAPEVIALIVRGSAFVFCAGSLWALLPLVAKDLRAGALGYGLLLAALGLGAVAAALALPRLKRRLSASWIFAGSVLVFAGATAALARVPQLPLLFLALFCGGGAWLSLLSSVNVGIQTVVPSWVRARALSVYLLCFSASLTGGSALWGLVAERTGTSQALLISVAGQILGLLLTFRLGLPSGEGLNLAPSRQWPAPLVYDLEPDQGPVMITVRYEIDPARAPEFVAAMQEVRRIRRRDGAYRWGLFRDTEAGHVYTEVFLVESWAEHLRQHERVTWTDRDVTDHARSFHVGAERPVVEHLIAART